MTIALPPVTHGLAPTGTATSISRVVIRNFKSIQGCDVRLGPMSLLVGPNGSGKSNFMDALRLTKDALDTNLENALRERGGIEDVRRRSTGHPTHFGIRLDINLPSGRAEYMYEVAARSNFTFEVQREECRVYDDRGLRASFANTKGQLSSVGSDLSNLRLARDALALPIVGGLDDYRPVTDALSQMGFYSFNPDVVRDLQNPDVGDMLLGDGRNLTSVIRRLRATTPDDFERVVEFLSTVVPGIRGIAARQLGPRETIEFLQEVVGDQRPWKFLAGSVSDGTLRALSVLVAAFQSNVSLVGIEEPETAIHPGAAGRLMDALLEASRKRQLILTTHSPDLLDHPDIDVDSVIAVQSQRGTTLVGPVDRATREAVQQNLYTVGELVRLEQVTPDVFGRTSAAKAVKLW